MKNGTLIFILLMTLPIVAGLSSATPEIPLTPIVDTLPATPAYHTIERLTIYNPVKRQCDASPLVTANNSRIDLAKLSRNEIRWMALSRNMLKRWNGAFNYGDTVELNANDPEIDGLWVINDTMNKRFENSGDLLFHRDKRRTGLWKNVRISHRAPKEKPVAPINFAGQDNLLLRQMPQLP